jgi:hypothetical protein
VVDAGACGAFGAVGMRVDCMGVEVSCCFRRGLCVGFGRAYMAVVSWIWRGADQVPTTSCPALDFNA